MYSGPAVGLGIPSGNTYFQRREIRVHNVGLYTSTITISFPPLVVVLMMASGGTDGVQRNTNRWNVKYLLRQIRRKEEICGKIRLAPNPRPSESPPPPPFFISLKQFTTKHRTSSSLAIVVHTNKINIPSEKLSISRLFD